MELQAFLSLLEKGLPDSQIRVGVAWLDATDTRIAVSPLEHKLENDAKRIVKKCVARLRREGDQPLQPGGDLSRGSFGRMNLEAASNSGLLNPGLGQALAKLQDFATAKP